MNLKTSFVVVCLAALAIAKPLIHRELVVDAGDNGLAAILDADDQETTIALRKLSRRRRTSCSGRGRGVTVTNIKTVTAGFPGVVNPEIAPTTDTSSSVTDTSSVPEIASTTASEVTDSSSANSFPGTSTAVVATDTSTATSVIDAGTSIAVTSTSTSLSITDTSFDPEPTSTTASGFIEPSSASPVVDTSSSIDATNTITSAVLTDTSTATVPETTAAPSDVPAAIPTGAVPVSRAGGTLNPTAVAEAQEFDKTAIRPVESVNIRAPDGRCLFIDPTAGDFRENLIPVQLVECDEEPNQKFDIVTKGKHNDGIAGKALLVSVLTNGCISFDARRPAGDTVTLFSCGGRAAGEGETDQAQLYPFDGSNNIVLAAASGNNETCVVAGNERLDSAPCSNGDDQVFEIVEVL